MPAPARDLKVDTVLPPTQPEINPIAAQLASSKDPAGNAAARILSKYLDELLRVPGTNVRFGLDPILALIPGVGDTVASSAGVIILFDALRSGIPIPVFLRMALNMGTNFLIGLVPGAGALASVFFKSNTRNLKLLLAWQAGHRHTVRRSTLHYYTGILILLAMVLGFILTAWAVYTWLFYSAAQAVLHALGFS
ncbi:DUF4112 domain-containing protein [Prosthecobacter fluviatilis]|uniref:DUF4112 domain-containing protein n=1 Tax=Prosthecobacter fluviatilis TaxID=445931 RepID=A0ABW0KVZ0_9BACT